MIAADLLKETLGPYVLKWYTILFAVGALVTGCIVPTSNINSTKHSDAKELPH